MKRVIGFDRARVAPRPAVLALAVSTLFSAAARAEPPPADTRLEAVVVTSPEEGRYVSKAAVGGKEPATLREIPQSVSVITRQRIEDQNLGTVADALNQVTGVTVVSNDTTQSQYRSRGHSLGITHDGIPSYNALSGYQQLDLAVYERVEVLRGPAGVFLGTGEPGGVVNLVRKRAQKAFAASGSLSAGSWNNYGLQADITGPLNEDGSVRARAVFSATDREYFYDRTDTRKFVGYATLDWDITPATTLSLAATLQDDETDAPYMGLPAWASGGLLKASRSTNPYPDWNRYEWNTKDFQADLTRRFDSGWSATVKLSRRDQDFYFKDSYPTTGVDPVAHTVNYGRRVRDYNYTRDAVDVFLSGPFRLFGREHRALFGYNRDSLLSAYDGVNAPAVAGVPFGRHDLVPEFDLPYTLGAETETRQSGYYGQLRLSLADPLTVSIGARVSDFRVRSRSVAPATPTAWATSANKTDGEVTPYAGVVFDLNPQVSLYASYSDIFIPQSQNKSGGGTLDPRVGKQYEIGAKGEFFDGKLNAALTLFKLRDENRAYEDIPDNPGFYLNAGKVESKGWEAEVAGSPAPGWDVSAGYTRLDTRYLKDRNNQGLPLTTWEPKHMLKLWGVRRFDSGPLAGFSIGLGASYLSETTAGSGTWAVRRQGGYTVANALLSYRIDKHLTLALNANNLFDKSYYTRLGGLNTYNSYGEPRNFALTLRAQY
ncbi:TonB-dependent siderophore receptor [Thauera linaloolentis]|uniref:TonB-dependent siderophore receptor n=1 Tax=Thauera linaloolentis (strain DSM 12138 / JCM 21573 / CCUG 41526 / CIP 105981 / IAM 15112 / NBRC 102519 / 47Lol) TaxID=1123367 RepID=N6Y663_THAL4|nr:TonB-dependent siderophore receptor [Thauera linaloolentis]ENO87085.1 TonB-dependent siderophore receptor [Thauera linaloolentis 47Lol = DSM 12138]MCM8565516.1 TonB-dependent siderophore receptor [Thauera linaloolentis]